MKSVNSCCLCKLRPATTTSKILTNSRITSYVIVAATITDTYLIVPTCTDCNNEISLLKTFKFICGVLSILAPLYALGIVFEVVQRIKNNQSFDPKIVVMGLLTITSAILFPYLFFKARNKFSLTVSKAKKSQVSDGVSQPSNVSQKVSNTTPEQFDKFHISSQSILWLEKELLKLNNQISKEDRPQQNPNFLQNFPKILLNKDKLTANDVADACIELVKQTRERIGKLDVPFRKPRVELTSKLPKNEPGHIEFGENETIIRIHPKYIDDPFALASILCHELAHFILDHNGLRKKDNKENERLTDLFVFRCGQGLIYLQGILDVTNENGYRTESRLGYLTLEEMAYAHVRCSSQHKLLSSKINPDYFSGRTFNEVKKAINFLSLKKNINGHLAEIILCPSNHMLRISTEKSSRLIRCPKCKWEKEIWIYKKDHYDFLINNGKREFNSNEFSMALKFFRDAQEIDKRNSLAYCLASRCLKKLGKHQEAIKELQKILSIYPEDVAAQNEMKNLIY